jgi:hypothetical protein
MRATKDLRLKTRLLAADDVAAWWIEMLGLIRLGAVSIPAMTLLTAKIDDLRQVRFRGEGIQYPYRLTLI